MKFWEECRLVESYVSDYLPNKYKKQHQAMLYLYDILVDILEKADNFNLANLSITFSDKSLEEFDILDKLSEQRDVDLSEKILLPHIFFSILKDLNYYLYESLSCNERGKVTVAFTLARKPLQDNLFYLSWILVDAKDFLSKILYSETKDYDVSNLKGQKDYMTNLFFDAKKILGTKDDIFNFSNSMINQDVLYDVIYNRKAKNSLTSVFDQSIHLVTNNRNYPTERQNLNFVFADDKIWDDFWNLYNEKIPYIMYYLVEVAVVIFENILKIDLEISEYNRYIRNLKFLMTVDRSGETKELESIFELLFKDEHINMTCDKCGEKYEFNDGLVKEIKDDFLFSCQKCGHVERIGQYFIDDEILKTRRAIIIDNSDDDNWKLG